MLKVTRAMTVECPSCNASFPVDPKKVPAGGVHARCSVCDGVFFVADPGLEADSVPQEEAIEVAAVDEPFETQDTFAEEFQAVPEPMKESFEEEPEAVPELMEEAFEEEPEAVPELMEEAFEEEPEAAPEPMEEAFEEEPEATPEPLEEAFEPLSEPVFDAPVETEPEPSDETSFDEPSQAFDETAFQAPSFGEPEPTFDMDAPDLGAPVEESPEPASEEPGPSPYGEPMAPTFEEPVVPTFEEPVEEAPAFQAPVTPILPTPQFGRRDPKEKAQRLARVLVSDIILYNPDRHQRALDEGRIRDEFNDEIQKSWAEYVEQVGDEIANSTDFFNEALNEILAKGDQMF